jgi:hypothetical protein
MTFGQSFLTQPDLFPARPAGAPWGDVEASIAFAGRRYLVRGMAPGQLARVRDRFGPLLAGVGEDDCSGAVPFDLFRAPAGEFLHHRPPLWEVTFDLDPEPRAVRVAGLRFAARLDWRPLLGAALWTSVGDDPELPMVFENVFRLLAAYDLAAAGGALVHSAAVEVLGGAVAGALVFFGPSGAGKTTVAERALEAGLRVLSDDLNALVLGGGQARVEKVPFAGTHGGGPQPVPPLPVLALCRLRQAPRVATAPLSTAAALAGLLAASPFVNADPFRAPALEASLLELARAVPVVELAFARDSPFAEIAGALARAGAGGPLSR